MAVLRVFGVVLLALVAFAYAAMFVSWNPATAMVVGFNTPWTSKLVEELPIWSLPFIGGVIGVFVMLFSSWALWSGQKRQADKYKRQVDKAKRIIAERNQEIEDREQRIAELEAEVAAAQAPEAASEVEAAPETAEETKAADEKPAAPKSDSVDEDDEEVI